MVGSMRWSASSVSRTPVRSQRPTGQYPAHCAPPRGSRKAHRSPGSACLPPARFQAALAPCLPNMPLRLKRPCHRGRAASSSRRHKAEHGKASSYITAAAGCQRRPGEAGCGHQVRSTCASTVAAAQAGTRHQPGSQFWAPGVGRRLGSTTTVLLEAVLRKSLSAKRLAVAAAVHPACESNC